MIVLRMISFATWYVGGLLQSYVRMLADIAAPGTNVTPAVVRYDTHCLTESHVGVLGMLITLSPGTIVLDARAHCDRGDERTPWTLYVHGIHHADPDELRASVGELERRMLTAWGHPEYMARRTAGGSV